MIELEKVIFEACRSPLFLRLLKIRFPKLIFVKH